ncbi:dolichyl-diphosphooligosaccharide--protein glycosyltransferase subunit 1 [Lingula anatina]|uniref:Dolichyl-diphosphooligosaccharide--protein glycosyltransferase subunit 1 n=1 Tax=Lingula anatina TaxID=7574 RepID=A0A1S3GYD0_LINAN|nr:dolichyl-diphosphooligosaccharide--protein glycosyltransferase subunit 1 [Lingula anatina]|eukprot:XP_013378880.1 dolichyl-diphosphooligosaccharide--protein glycosyltransferase subunit 1 [Lingula anatina]
MEKFSIELIVVSTLLATCCTANQDTVNTAIVNSNVERKIDISTHLAKVTNVITLENTGKGAVRSFLFALEDADAKDRLSFIGAQTKVEDGEDSNLPVSETTVTTDAKGAKFWRIDIPALGEGSTTTVTVETVFTHILRPYPAQITQGEKQLMQYHGNLYYYSPYSTKTQTTSVQLSSSTIESYTKTKPVSVNDKTITYGPYESRPAFTKGEVVIHYENNTPFLTVTHLTRTIEVSHWGNIAVEETFDMYHTGAKLKGPFSRYDYQRHQDGASSIKSFKTVLPANAKDIYYRDEIGNISTSNLREQDEGMELELRPRFPLFGGWKTHYTIGYNIPAYQYLYNSGSNYALKMPFVDHVYDDQVIDYITVKIILPEGSKNIQFNPPYDVKRDADSLHFTYLDTVGRPVVTLHKTNLVENHIQDFQLDYTFGKVLLLQEPLLVVLAFWLLFTVVIIYVRLDFSITKDEASESRMRVAGLVEEVQNVHDKRSALYQSYDDAVDKYKANKDTAAFTAQRKKIDADYKALTEQFKALQAKLKQEGTDVAEKVAELQRLDTQFREQVNIAISYAEKLIAGKIPKAQYLEAETSTKSKKEDILGKMENIVTSL